MKVDFDISKFEEPDLEKFQADLCAALVERVKLRTPVRTGKLKESIYGEVVDGAIELGSESEYVLPVEYGTVKMAGAHMFSLALEDGDAIAESIKVENITTNQLPAASAAPSAGKVSLSK